MSTSENQQDDERQGFYSLHKDLRQISRQSKDAKSAGYSTLLFENERIRVLDFRLPPGQKTEILHKFPTIRWQVDEGKHRLEGEVGLEESVKDRQVFYAPSGTTWQLTNTAAASIYRQVVFELLSETPKHSEQEVKQLLDQARYSTNVGTSLLFENHLCRVWDFYLEPGEGGGADTVHHHCLDYVFINVAPSRLLGLHPETLDMDNLLFDSVSQENDVTWNSIPDSAALDPTYAHGGKNGDNDRPMREYLVELK